MAKKVEYKSKALRAVKSRLCHSQSLIAIAASHSELTSHYIGEWMWDWARDSGEEGFVVWRIFAL